MKRIGAIALLIGIVAATVIWRRQPRADGRSEASGRLEHAKKEAEVEPALAPTRALVPDESPTTKPAPASFAELIASGLASVVPSAPNGIEVHVVDGDTRAPVAGALVAALDIELLIRRHLLWKCILERLPEIAHDLLLARTDERGVTFLPRTMQQGIVWAEATGRFGKSGVLGGTSKPVTIAIEPSCSLRVIVVDAEGRPLPDVEVAVGTTTERTAAPDGLALFKHLELTNDLRERRGSTRVASVSLCVANSDPPSVEVELREDGSEPVRLVAPRGGRLALRLVDRDGHPVARRAGGELAPEGPGERGDWSFEFTFDERGEALLQCVETGHRFKLTATPTECDESLMEVLGPNAIDETTKVDVPIGKPHIVLAGRFVDESGRQVTGMSALGRVELTGTDGSVVARTVSVRLDEEAAFRLDWTEAHRDDDDPPSSIRWHVDSHEPLESKPLPLPPLPTSGEVELGAIVVGTPPLLARGVVVNEAGEPVPRAVVVERYAKDEQISSDGPRAVCDESGRFELHGIGLKDDLSIAAIAADGEQSDPIPLAGVDHELRIVIARFGAVRGRLRPAPGFALPLQFTLSDPASGEQKGFAARDAAPDGSFKIVDVPPGRYSFEVSVESEIATGETLLTIPDVVVNPASITDDPRLLDLDPWNGSRIVEVTALESDGSPCTGVEGILVDEDGFESGTAVSAEDGTVRIPTKRQRVSVAIRAAGCRPAVVSDVIDHATLTLPPMLVVHVVIPPLPESEKRGTVEEVDFDPLTFDHRFPRRWQNFYRAVGGRREVDIGVPIPGTFIVRLQIDQGDAMLESFDARPVTILDVNEPQRIELVAMPATEGR